MLSFLQPVSLRALLDYMKFTAALWADTTLLLNTLPSFWPRQVLRGPEQTPPHLRGRPETRRAARAGYSGMEHSPVLWSQAL